MATTRRQARATAGGESAAAVRQLREQVRQLEQRAGEFASLLAEQQRLTQRLSERVAVVEKRAPSDGGDAGPEHSQEPKRFVWAGDWSTLPGTLTVHHMAAICGVGIDTIWYRIREKRIRPHPISWVRPYRWNKATVQATIQRGAAG